MSIGKKFSSRSAQALQMHMPAMPPKIDNPAGTAISAAPPAATFGPATYYRLGVLTPGGPTKRSGSR